MSGELVGAWRRLWYDAHGSWCGFSESQLNLALEKSISGCWAMNLQRQKVSEWETRCSQSFIHSHFQLLLDRHFLNDTSHAIAFLSPCVSICLFIFTSQTQLHTLFSVVRNGWYFPTGHRQGTFSFLCTSIWPRSEFFNIPLWDHTIRQHIWLVRPDVNFVSIKNLWEQLSWLQSPPLYCFSLIKLYRIVRGSFNELKEEVEVITAADMSPLVWAESSGGGRGVIHCQQW